MKHLRLVLALFLLNTTINLFAQQKIYWANNSVGVMSANLDGTGIKTLIKNRVLSLSSIDIDTTNNKVYWTDNSKMHIGRSNLDGSNSEILIELTNSIPSNIRVDNISNKIYWIEAATKKLFRANLDGTIRETVASNLPDYFNFELDIKNNKIYWIDGTNGKIVKSNLDNTGTEDIVKGVLGVYPRNLKLDRINNRVYWLTAEIATDSFKFNIKSAKLDGSDTKTLFTKNHDLSNFSSTEFEINPITNTLYIKDIKDSNASLTILVSKLDGSSLSAPYGYGVLPVFSLYRSDIKNNKLYAIENSRIFQISFPTLPSLYTYKQVSNETIIGPTGIAIDKNVGKIYWADKYNGKIQRSNLDGTNIEDLVNRGLFSPTGIALDLVNKNIYWTEFGNNSGSSLLGVSSIKKSNLDGTNVQTIISNLVIPGSISLDIPNKKLYYTEQGLTGIYKANFDGTSIEKVILTRNPYIVEHIALDLENKKVYWSEGGIVNAIIRANLDGTQPDTFAKRPFVRVGGISLDITNKRVYRIIDSVLQRVNFDGTNSIDLIKNLPGLTSFNGYLTWGATHSYVKDEILSSVSQPIDFTLPAKVFPSIFQDFITIDLDDASSNELTYQLFDFTGRLIKTGNVDKSKTVSNLSFLENGVYLFKLINSNKSYTAKIIKQ